MSKKNKKKMVINPQVMSHETEERDLKPIRTLGYGKTKLYDEQIKMLNDAGVFSMLGDGMYSDIPQFPGYMTLAQMSQDGVIRAGVELRADEMTRRWIEFTYQGEDGDEGKIEALEEDMDRLHVDKVFRDAIQMCGFYGGCLVYLDVGDIGDEDLKNPIGEDKTTLKEIKDLKIIEPFYIAPAKYQAYNPLDKDYFVPQAWLINGREIHASRFLYFAESKVPSLLLPTYNFFGIPLAQSVLDAVIGFEKSSQASARMLSKYACTVFKTDMNEVLAGGSGSEIQKRIAYFAQNRDNDGLMTVDMDSEDIVLSNHTLSGVTDIVRQQMEIVSAMFGEPAVKLWGISPNGFNATGESDMRSHYDHINAVQERIMRDPLTYLLNLIQINRFGDVDSNLSFTFVPLSDEDQRLKAETNKINVESMVALYDRGIISGEEARHVLATDEDSGYTDIDEDAEIQPPDEQALPMESGWNSIESDIP